MDLTISPHLFIEGLRLNLSVGCNEDEKTKLQPMEIDLWIVYPKAPKGCASDCLEDAVCYEKCTQIARKAAEKKHFQLIEHLAYEIHAALKSALPPGHKIGVRVGKPEHPLLDVKKAIRFSYYG